MNVHSLIHSLLPVWQRWDADYGDLLPLETPIGEGDVVADELGRVGYVDILDASPYGCGLAAYVVFGGGESADWISVSRLALLDSVVDVALASLTEAELKKALAS